MRKLTNNASTVLAVKLDALTGDGDPNGFLVPITLSTAFPLINFPNVDVSPSDYAYCTVQAVDGHYEIVKLVELDRDLGTGQIRRGQKAFPAGHPDAPPSTALAEFAAGSRFELRVTAGLFADVIQRDGDTLHGGVWAEPPTFPVASTTIITKHSTSIASGDPGRVPTLGDLVLGELCWNARTKKIWGEGVNESGSPARHELVSGLHWGGAAEPAAHFRTQGTFWYDAIDFHNTLMLWSGSAWVPCIDLTLIQTDIILPNNKALQAHGIGAEVASIFDLVKVNAANEGVVGDTDLAMLKLLATTVQVSPKLRIAAANSANGTWDFVAGIAGMPRLNILPNMSAGLDCMITLNTRNAAGTNRLFTFDERGQITQPNLVPTQDGDLVPLKYLTDYVGGVDLTNAGALLASGQITGPGATVGTQKGCTVARTGLGTYVITLPPASPLSNKDNATVLVTAIGGPGAGPKPGAVADIVVWVSSTTTIEVTTYTAGSQTDPADRAFSFLVIDRGA